MNTERERLRRGGRQEEKVGEMRVVKRDEVNAETYVCLKFTEVLTDVTFFALFCFVAQAYFKSVDFTWQVAETTDKQIC